jgi:hypothetical protein
MLLRAVQTARIAEDELLLVMAGRLSVVEEFVEEVGDGSLSGSYGAGGLRLVFRVWCE